MAKIVMMIMSISDGNDSTQDSGNGNGCDGRGINSQGYK